jgi:hypothetical protein
MRKLITLRRPHQRHAQARGVAHAARPGAGTPPC